MTIRDVFRQVMTDFGMPEEHIKKSLENAALHMHIDLNTEVKEGFEDRAIDLMRRLHEQALANPAMCETVVKARMAEIKRNN